MQKSNWKKYKLESLCTKIFSGGTPKSTVSSYYGGDIPWLRTQEVNFQNIYDTDIKITEAGLKNSSAKWVNKNTVIIAMYGNSAGRSAIAKIPLTTNQACCCLEIASNKADYKFIYNFLKWNYQQIKDLANGGAQQNLNSLIIKNLEIDLPPIEEQKRIAGVLGAFDDKIELLQKQNTTLENMAKALFKSWFVDFDVVYAKQQGQPKAAVMQQYHLTEKLYNLFPSSFEPSALGPIPTGWQVKAAQEIANILIGRTPPRKESKWFSNDSKNHVWISIKDLGNCGIFINNSSEYLTEEAVNKFRIPIIPANTVVLSFKLTVGRVAISGRNMLSNEAIAQFQNSILPPSYLYFTLKNTNFSSLGSTSSIATAINSNTIKHMDILVANTKIIDIFTNEVEPLFNKIQTNNKQIQTLTEMRDALLPRLISGKIRV